MGQPPGEPELALRRPMPKRGLSQVGCACGANGRPLRADEPRSTCVRRGRDIEPRREEPRGGTGGAGERGKSVVVPLSGARERAVGVTELVDRDSDLDAVRDDLLERLLALAQARDLRLQRVELLQRRTLRLLTRRRGGYVHGRGDRRDPNKHQETLHLLSFCPPAPCVGIAVTQQLRRGPVKSGAPTGP